MTEGREILELQTLNALRGAEDVRKRLLTELSTGAPSIADLAYAIKIRIKEDYSMVDKVFRKRKENNDPQYDVTRLRDIVGLRIVTLYRLDAIDIIRALLAKILAPTADISLFVPKSLEEVVVFSTNPTGDAQGLVSRLNTIFDDNGLKDKFKVANAPSNYTSIHMVVWCRGKYGLEYRNVPVEIQVRTALEDVWGEIDHSLKYKRQRATEGEVVDEKRVESVLSHLNVMKTLVDGVAQYADQIKIQLDEIDNAGLPSSRSRPAEDPIKLLRELPDLPDKVITLVSEATDLERATEQEEDENVLLKNLQQVRAKLEESRSVLDNSTEVPEQSRLEAKYIIDMGIALALFEIGKRVESGANVLAEAEKIYHQCEEMFPNRALIKYRHSAVLDALGDRSSAIAKLKEVARLIQQGNSGLPEGHWVRSASARYLGALLWEEGDAIRSQKGAPDGTQRALEYYLDAFKTTLSIYGVTTNPGPRADAVPESAKVANNLLYYALEYLEKGGLEAHLLAAGFKKEHIMEWLQEISGYKVDEIKAPSLVDTVRRAFVYLDDWQNAAVAANRFLSLVSPDRAATSRLLSQGRRDARDTLLRANGRGYDEFPSGSGSEDK